MTYQEILEKAKKGKTCLLPNYKGYFNYNYGSGQLYFHNGDYYKGVDEELKKRNDWYFIT